MTMGPWGIHFDRTNTWWNQGRAWLQYLARCQSLLQQGLFVADLAYFVGENPGGYTKVDRGELDPIPPAGYDYDLMNAEVIMQRAKIQNGRIVLPDGMSYRALVLQNPKGLSLGLLRKLRDFVHQGMILIGNRPENTLGLQGFPEDQAVFENMVSELWGNSNNSTLNEQALGKGHVYWGKSLQTILEGLDLKPDFRASSRSGNAPVTYIHRRIADAEVYFISNQRRSLEELVCTFRVQGKQPEQWDPATGNTSPIGVYELAGDQVHVPLQLEPYGSAFIVFRSPAPQRHLQAVLKDNKAILSTEHFPKKNRKLYNEGANNFSISFWAKPEFNIMLSTANFMENIEYPWTEYYAIYPLSGEEYYGAGHATAGLAVGRNGVAVWEHGSGKPVLVLAAPASLSGWSHIGLVYQEGAPLVYVDGILIEKGTESKNIVHPGLGNAKLEEGASFYNGDMSEPQLFSQALSAERIRQLAAEEVPVGQELPVLELALDNRKPALYFWQNGNYSLQDNMGKGTTLPVSSIPQPMEISGPWQLNFPPNLGAPEQITLPRLISLHEHAADGVKHFSGTATYRDTARTSQYLQIFFPPREEIPKGCSYTWARCK